MTLSKSKLAAATAIAAACSLAALPAAAAQLPRVPGQAMPQDPDALNVEGHGHGGYHGGHYGHHDDWHIDGDDVLTGVLILGGLAAIAGIAGSHQHTQPYPVPAPYPDAPPPPPQDSGYQTPPPSQNYRAGGMAQAVDVCVSEVESSRGAVGSVDRASRSGEGWYVAGQLDGGGPFACWLDADGRVTNIRAGGDGASNESPDDAPLAAASEDRASYVTALQKQGGGEAAGYEVAQAGALEN